MRKNPPNPYGRKGCPEHIDLMNQVAEKVEKKGLIAKLEFFIRLITGKGRAVDVAGLDSQTNIPVEFHQIGKQNKNMTPVKRERDILDEIEQETKIRPEFHPYNKV
jgi:hypothetical protein